MIKLSELKDDAKVIDDNMSVYTVEEVKYDLKYFKDSSKRLYTVNEHHASIDAESMLDSAIDEVYQDMMYEDWDEDIKLDITKEDIGKIQAVLDDIFSRDKDQNISYFQSEEIEIDTLEMRDSEYSIEIMKEQLKNKYISPEILYAFKASIQALEKQAFFENQISNISDWFVNNKDELLNTAFTVSTKSFDQYNENGKIDEVDLEFIVSDIVDEIQKGILNVLSTYMGD